MAMPHRLVLFSSAVTEVGAATFIFDTSHHIVNSFICFFCLRVCSSKSSLAPSCQRHRKNFTNIENTSFTRTYAKCWPVVFIILFLVIERMNRGGWWCN